MPKFKKHRICEIYLLSKKVQNSVKYDHIIDCWCGCLSTIHLQTALEATLGIWCRKHRVEAWATQGKPSRLLSTKEIPLQATGWSPQLWALRSGWKGLQEARPHCSVPWLPGWSCDVVMRALFTFAVSIVIDLDFGSSEAGISMQLAVVEVGLAVAATHRPLVRFALLKQTAEDVGAVRAECVCARAHTHTHTHARTQSHLVTGVPTSRDAFYAARATGSLSSGISDPTPLVAGGTSPCSPSWCSVLILAQGHLFYSMKRNKSPLLQPYQISRKGILFEVRNLDYLSLYHFVESQSMSLDDIRSLKIPTFYDTKQPELGIWRDWKAGTYSSLPPSPQFFTYSRV